MKRKPVKSVDEYINNFPPKIQVLLEKIRRVIKKNLPKETEETISYSIPTYKLDGKYMVYLAGFENHISMYPFLESIGKAAEKYRSGRGTVKFPLDKPLPLELIKKLVKANLKRHRERAKARKSKG